jgi:hypothetical protein
MSKQQTPTVLIVVFVASAAGIWSGCKNQPPAKGDAPATAPSAQIAATSAAAPASPGAAPAAFDPSKAETNGYGEPVRKGSDFPVATPFMRDTRTFTIKPLDGVEFNYRMEKGGTMVYSWTASDGLNWDFHGEPKGSEPGYAESYAEGEGKDGNGAFIAPTSGLHGWFWENQGNKPVTLTLKTAGHFTEGLLTMPDDTKAPRPLNPR